MKKYCSKGSTKRRHREANSSIRRYEELGYLHGIAAIQKGKKKEISLSKLLDSEKGERTFPDGQLKLLVKHLS